ncbi:unnamed protein product [Moneuplotes crassus]|uniref:Uncharacterized protein n=1 Tax=Euplotes crassus TaxID=5936 RepID=A0AAD1U589_EUPCR|nr:unnamed protein product [Moneuplotes crassus]
MSGDLSYKYSTNLTVYTGPSGQNKYSYNDWLSSGEKKNVTFDDDNNVYIVAEPSSSYNSFAIYLKASKSASSSSSSDDSGSSSGTVWLVLGIIFGICFLVCSVGTTWLICAMCCGGSKGSVHTPNKVNPVQYPSNVNSIEPSINNTQMIIPTMYQYTDQQLAQMQPGPGVTTYQNTYTNNSLPPIPEQQKIGSSSIVTSAIPSGTPVYPGPPNNPVNLGAPSLSAEEQKVAL